MNEVKVGQIRRHLIMPYEVLNISKNYATIRFLKDDQKYMWNVDSIQFDHIDHEATARNMFDKELEELLK